MVCVDIYVVVVGIVVKIELYVFGIFDYYKEESNAIICEGKVEIKRSADSRSLQLDTSKVVRLCVCY